MKQTKILLPNIKVSKNFANDILELEKQYIRLVSEIKANEPTKSIDAILEEVNLSKTKYYTIKNQIESDLKKTFITV